MRFLWQKVWDAFWSSTLDRYDHTWNQNLSQLVRGLNWTEANPHSWWHKLTGTVRVRPTFQIVSQVSPKAEGVGFISDVKIWRESQRRQRRQRRNCQNMPQILFAGGDTQGPPQDLSSLLTRTAVLFRALQRLRAFGGSRCGIQNSVRFVCKGRTR